jgi:hypothetical protein
MSQPTAGVVVDFPLHGVWTVERTPAHRVPSHGTDLFAQRFAYDFIRTDERRGVHPHPGSRLRWLTIGGPTHEHYAWGQPVHAALAGRVVAAHDGVTERRWLHPLVETGAVLSITRTVRRASDGGTPIDPASIAGNHVIVDSGDTCALYAHLSPGSVGVRVDDQVAAGQPLGRVGHSGNSTAPHLHFQLMDGPDPLTAAGVRPRFAAYDVWRGDRWERVERGEPDRWERIRRRDPGTVGSEQR